MTHLKHDVSFLQQVYAHPLGPPLGQYTQAMSKPDPPPSNIFADFPPDQFEILAFCDPGGHRGAVDRSSVPENSEFHPRPGYRTGEGPALERGSCCWCLHAYTTHTRVKARHTVSRYLS